MAYKERGDHLYPPGTAVRLENSDSEHEDGEAPEFGVVVHCWKSEELGGMHDCYVAFFGHDWPDGQPIEKPYVLRYASVSLIPVQRV